MPHLMKYGRDSRAVKLFFTTLFILLSIVSAINIIVDPGEIYLKKVLQESRSTEFVEKLVNSKYGLVQSGWNERLVKTALARRSGNYDCVVIGSSHVMQISATRHGSISAQCGTLLNLGVSGGSLEDIAIFAYLITDSAYKPKKVFIGIDPWTIKFNMDSRWGENKPIYDKMGSLIKTHNNGGGTSYVYRKIINLINIHYFEASIKLIADGKTSLNKNDFSQKEIVEAKAFNFDRGYKETVTLPDGSHVYDESYILNQARKTIEVGGGDYKIDGVAYDTNAINFLVKIVEIIRESGISVDFILTPYHENVFALGETKVVKNIREVDHLVKQLSGKLNIPYYGSYFPAELKCTSTEFFDFMHAKRSCLDKIKY